MCEGEAPMEDRAKTGLRIASLVSQVEAFQLEAGAAAQREEEATQRAGEAVQRADDVTAELVACEEELSVVTTRADALEAQLNTCMEVAATAEKRADDIAEESEAHQEATGAAEERAERLTQQVEEYKQRLLAAAKQRGDEATIQIEEYKREAEAANLQLESCRKEAAAAVQREVHAQAELQACSKQVGGYAGVRVHTAYERMITCVTMTMAGGAGSAASRCDGCSAPTIARGLNEPRWAARSRPSPSGYHADEIEERRARADLGMPSQAMSTCL